MITGSFDPGPLRDRLRAGPLLLVGGGGMLGRAFRERLGLLGLPFTAPSRLELDLLRPDTVAAALRARPPIVVNCAAWTNVDGAETDPQGASALNGAAVGELSRACRDAGAKLVHFSTDYVFSGISKSPYRIDQSRDPVNAYGRSKAEGEHAIEQTRGDALILRTSWLYAPWGTNFVRTIVRAARQRPVLRVVNDQRGRPTSAEHLAVTTLALLARDARGVLHATDDGDCTWFDLASLAVKLSGAQAKVEPCTSEEFPRPAKRPLYSVLDLAPTRTLVGELTPWEETLAQVMPRLEP